MIGKLLEKNTNLSKLFLHNNPIGPVASELIAKGVQMNSGVTILDLSYCLLGRRRTDDPAVLSGVRKRKKDENLFPPRPVLKSETMNKGKEKKAQAKLDKIELDAWQKKCDDIKLLIPPRKAAL